jgi:hypothetical protein
MGNSGPYRPPYLYSCLPGHCLSHANILCVNTTVAMGDEVDVDVGDGLPCCGSGVDADVEAVR